ncbi:hypothetical protein [Aeromonas hydrophila]|uniref:hypothetical protein n=1 Tax=Aeromonas hydrophila TaxID=644 RepID=UPI003D1B350A
MIKNTLLLSFLVAFSASSFAVEGYKDLAFGSSEADLLAKKLCTMKKVETGMARVAQYNCNDFKFGGRMTTASAFFIDGEFLRLGVDVAWSEMTTVSDLIFKKYGPLSSLSTEEEMRALDTTPNVTAYWAFEHDTVYLMMQTDANMQKAGVVMYSAPSFEQKALEVQQSAMDSAL